MKRIALLALLVFTAVSAAAQSSSSSQAKVSVRRQSNNTVEFFVEDKTYPGTSTVWLYLKNLSNCTENERPFRREVQSDKERILTLRPADASRPVGFSYAYRFFNGRLLSSVDSTYIYCMPVAAGKEVRVVRYDPKPDEIDKRIRESIIFTFQGEKGDTVFAMRRGKVVRVGDDDTYKRTGQGIKISENAAGIQIEHPDGTMARYSCLDHSGMMVAPGDEVFPGTPLAFMGSYDDKKYGVRVEIGWYGIKINDDGSERPAPVKHFAPVFATAEGNMVLETRNTYTAVVSEELVTKEMSKKEIKARAGNKK